MTVEQQMSTEELSEILAGLKGNVGVTLSVGSSESRCLTILGLYVLFKLPFRAQSKDLRKVVLSEGYCLKRSEESNWLLREGSVKAREFNLLSIKVRDAVAA